MDSFLSIYFWKEFTCLSCQQLLCASAFTKGLQKVQVIFVSLIFEEFNPIPDYKQQYQPLCVCAVMNISLRTTTPPAFKTPSTDWYVVLQDN